MQNRATLQRRRETLIGRAHAILDGVDELNDDGRAEVDKIRAEIEAIDSDTERIDKLAALDVAAAKPPDADYAAAKRRFSITRALADAMGWRSANDDYGLEREVQSELRAQGMAYEGIPAPLSALDKRIVTIGGNQADDLVEDDLRPGDYIPALRDALVVRRLGIRTLSGLRGDVTIPKADTIATAGWATETGAFAETTPTFQSIQMTPHKMGTWTEFTRQAVIQTTPAIEGLLRDDLTQAMANLLDTTVILGHTSAAAPDGVTDLITNTARANDTNGAALTFEQLEALPLALDNDNVGMNARAWLLAPRTRNSLMGLPRFASNGDRAAELAYQNGRILGERAVVSNIIPINQTHGTENAATSIYYANWTDGLLGIWDSLDLLLNPYADASFKRGSIMLRAMMWADFNIRHTESFAYYDAVTA